MKLAISFALDFLPDATWVWSCSHRITRLQLWPTSYHSSSWFTDIWTHSNLFFLSQSQVKLCSNAYMKGDHCFKVLNMASVTAELQIFIFRCRAALPDWERWSTQGHLFMISSSEPEWAIQHYIGYNVAALHITRWGGVMVNNYIFARTESNIMETEFDGHADVTQWWSRGRDWSNFFSLLAAKAPMDSVPPSSWFSSLCSQSLAPSLHISAVSNCSRRAGTDTNACQPLRTVRMSAAAHSVLTANLSLQTFFSLLVFFDLQFVCVCVCEFYKCSCLSIPFITLSQSFYPSLLPCQTHLSSAFVFFLSHARCEPKAWRRYRT